jgi:hypothetical protein
MSARLLSRRDFLKQVLFHASGWAFYPILNWTDRIGEEDLVRVTTRQVNIHSQPDRKSDVVMRRNRDEILKVYYPIDGSSGRNSLWYRVWGGFMHSAYLQPVKVCHTPALTKVPDEGILAEVGVPFSQTYRRFRTGRWDLNYRLYYGSTHWIIGFEEGPDGRPWYLLKDSYERTYHVFAEHLRPVPDEELTPITPDIARGKKWIDISVAEQVLTAYEDDVAVMKTTISSGLPQIMPLEPGQIPSDTPLGHFHITVKTPSRHMGDKELTGDLHTGALPGVPWVSFFHENGVALHGTYWHANYGVRMSSGCINMKNEDAKWIYRWVQPFIQPNERQTSAWGTRVFVHE